VIKFEPDQRIRVGRHALDGFGQLLARGAFFDAQQKTQLS
jgi:hypothetical protein